MQPIDTILAVCLSVCQALQGLLGLQAERERAGQAPGIKRTLTAMMQLHHFAQQALLQSLADPAPGKPHAHEVLERAVHKAAQFLDSQSAEAAHFLQQLQNGQLDALASSVKEERARKVDEEVQAVQGLAVSNRCDAEAVSCSEAVSLSGEQVQRLELVIRKLRALEQDPLEQARLASDVEAATSDHEYSDENYAHGSTPYTSWFKVLSDPEVRSAVQNAMQGDRHQVVWGSSSGWLLFYGHITFGWRSVGYELLPCLCERADATQQLLGVPASSVQTWCVDMLTSSLADVGLLILANQCWDKALGRSAAAKLASELPVSAVCVEYTGLLRSQKNMQLVARVSAPVSWKQTGGIVFHVWVKERECDEQERSSRLQSQD